MVLTGVGHTYHARCKADRSVDMMMTQRHCAAGSFRRPFSTRPNTVLHATAITVEPVVADAIRKPNFPFVRIQGQEEMKLAICLNVVDPRIGGVLIMGDRGTGKSVTVSGR